MQSDAPDVFDCKQCGECCTGYGGTYVTEDDIRSIAEFVGMTEDEFRITHTEMAAVGRPVLRIGEDGKCRFHKDRLCGIHPVKPRMCREWPFIPGVLRDPNNWRLMANACPGIREDAAVPDITRRVLEELGKTRPGFTWPTSTDASAKS